MARKFSSKRELFSIAAPVDKPSIEIWHSTAVGFGARLMRENSRTGAAARVYLARYKNADGKDVKEVLGSFDSIEYADAQVLALERKQAAKTLVKEGIRKLPTLGGALTLYIEDRRSKLSESTIADYTRRWKLLEQYHEHSVGLLNSAFWLDVHRKLLERGRPTADGVIRVAHAVFKDLVNDERIASNPVQRVASKQAVYAAGTARSSIIERAALPILWQWLHMRAHATVRDYVLLALLQGLRSAVLGTLRWENVDMENRNIRLLPEQRGNKAKKLVNVPVSDWVYENILKPRYDMRAQGAEWVIPSSKKFGGPLHSIKGSLDAFTAETGINVNPHMLRRTFATIAQQATNSTLTVGRMLTHTHAATRFDNAAAVTAGYVVTGHETLRDAFNATTAKALQFCTEPSK